MTNLGKFATYLDEYYYAKVFENNWLPRKILLMNVYFTDQNLDRPDFSEFFFEPCNVIIDASWAFGRLVYGFGRPNSSAQKLFFKFFQFYFIKKNVDVAINDFTKPLIISI